MRGRRLFYLLSLLGSVVFYGIYREWFSWFLLVTVFLLPGFSLILSLPALLTVQATLRCPESVRMGVPAKTALQVTCRFPAPPVSCKIRLYNSLTDTRYVGKAGELIPTDHCGYITISYDRLAAYDYLGLFRFRLAKGECAHIYVEPKPLPAHLPEGYEGKHVSLWKPKAGGGFSENHDLRQYRPGDDLRGMHWKMSAKTGKLIYREPIEPAQKGYLLTVALHGDPDTVDRKLGQLVWLSQSLLQRNAQHAVRCQTGAGTLRFSVSDNASYTECLHTLLRSKKTVTEQQVSRENVLWQHHIGGDSNETS